MSSLQPELSAVLERLDVPLGLAEAQGLACGLLCSRPAGAAKSRWFSELLDAAAMSPAAVAARASDLHALDAWFGTTLGALNDAELDFSLALPDDDEPIDRRSRALGDFCAGFVYGIGIGVAAQGNPPLPADTRELLEDFMAIDGADAPAPDDAATTATQDEEAFVELTEYVRVGVLLVNEELKPVTPLPTSAGAASRGDTKTPRLIH